MTANQIARLNYLENSRANQARELETNRSNIANEAEKRRSNLANEFETRRSNVARETETNRHNVETESETRRHNKAGETIDTVDVVGKTLFGKKGLVGSVTDLIPGASTAKTVIKGFR